MGSDRRVLSSACVELAMKLLVIPLPSDHPLANRLCIALSHCILLPCLSMCTYLLNFYKILFEIKLLHPIFCRRIAKSLGCKETSISNYYWITS